MPEQALHDIVAGVLALSLNAYVLLGGADFGGGVWDLLASGPRRDRQRDVITHAIGPIWEANHVWLILAIVLTFTCFSPVFARLGTVLHVPLTLMLLGIVLRGSAFTFRTYDNEQDTAQRRWGRVFAGASLITQSMAPFGERLRGKSPRISKSGSMSSDTRGRWLRPASISSSKSRASVRRPDRSAYGSTRTYQG